MQGEILKMGRKGNLHLVYVNSKDLSSTKISPTRNIIDTLKNAVDDLIKSQTLIDRLICYELIKSLSDDKEIQYESFPCTSHYLNRYKEQKKHIQYSLLEIYPLTPADIDLTNFNSEELIKHMKIVSSQCNFWYV